MRTIGLMAAIGGLVIALFSGILGYVIFSTFIWIILGVAISIIGFIFLTHLESNTTSAAQLYNEHVQRLKRIGDRIEVDLRKCKIRSSSLTAPKKQLDYLDALEGISIMVDVEHAHDKMEHSVLIYQHQLPSGKYITLYGPTNKDKETLSLLCTLQKKSVIYLDKEDPTNYYFDLEFINNQ